MEKVFKYGRPDRLARNMTLVWLLLIGGAFVLIWRLWSEGGYVIAWAVSLVVAIIALCLLSVPRNIRVGSAAVEICCVVEITRIPIEDIASVRTVGQGGMKGMVPLFAGFAFFGYYGYYWDLNGWETVKVYCTDRANMVEITDIYEKRYFVSCPHPEELVAAIIESPAYSGSTGGDRIGETNMETDVETDTAIDAKIDAGVGAEADTKIDAKEVAGDGDSADSDSGSDSDFGSDSGSGFGSGSGD